MPMVITIIAKSVQYVDRTDRILVNSERSVPPNPARPALAGTTVARRLPAAGAVTVMSGHPSRAYPIAGFRGLVHGRPAAGAELYAGRGLLHVGLFQGGLGHGQFMQPDPALVGKIAYLVGRQAVDHERVPGGGDHLAAGPVDRSHQRVRLRGADPDRLHRVALDELGHAAVGDEPAAPDHDQMVSGVLHLR